MTNWWLAMKSLGRDRNGATPCLSRAIPSACPIRFEGNAHSGSGIAPAMVGEDSRSGSAVAVQAQRGPSQGLEPFCERWSSTQQPGPQTQSSVAARTTSARDAWSDTRNIRTSLIWGNTGFAPRTSFRTLAGGAKSGSLLPGRRERACRVIGRAGPGEEGSFAITRSRNVMMAVPALYPAGPGAVSRQLFSLSALMNLLQPLDAASRLPAVFSARSRTSAQLGHLNSYSWGSCSKARPSHP